ncbi:MAG: IS66 family insertion sequence element accessory protein TnpB [bacterium]
MLWSGGVKIYVASQATDMRRGIDGLVALVASNFGEDVYSGALFVFLSRRMDRLKILTWDAGGFVVYYKRLEQGRFKQPRVSSGAAETTIDAAQLAMLLRGIDLSRVRKPVLWEPPESKGIDKPLRS